MIRRALLVSAVAGFALWSLPRPVPAEDDGVRSSGRLSDGDFLRLVTCGAAPGGDCRGPVVRWPHAAARDITVTFALAGRDVDRDAAQRISREVDRAIGVINGAGAGVRLVRTEKPRANIRIYVTETPEGGRLARSIDYLGEGSVMPGVGFVTVWWNGRYEIDDAVILYSDTMQPRDMRSIALEELTQALGFRFDITNEWYNGRSIFAQDSNETVGIEGQDLMALRSLYPPMN